MIYLYHGKDTYRSRLALVELRGKLRGDDEMFDSNTTLLDGKATSPQELLAHATAVPFLASHRLVVVDGLIVALGEMKRGRGKKKDDDPLVPWRAAFATLGDKAAVPESTTLVFHEGDLGKENAIFPLVAPIARTVEFADISKNERAPWIEAEAKRRRLKLAPRAISSLAELIGSDLWMLTNELDKLSAYAGSEVVEQETVERLVSAAGEAIIWDFTAAVVAGNESKALATLSHLIAEGEPPTKIAFMVVREYRQLALVKDLRERRAGKKEIARATGMPEFRVDPVSAIANRYSWLLLHEAYRLLLEADLDVKRGLQGDEASLQVLIHELCALAPRAASAGRTAYAR